MIRVFVADDHAVVRRGVTGILNEEPGIVVVAEASSGQELLQLARDHQADVLVLDMGLPDMTGLEVMHQLHAMFPGIHVLILSIYPEEQYAIRALRAGALGYLTKESAATELVAAVRKIYRGDRYISESLGELLAGEFVGDGAAAAHAALSDREYQVMLMLARGKSVGDIGNDLSLSVKTISTYRSRILAKLNLETTADIIRYALRHNLVD